MPRRRWAFVLCLVLQAFGFGQTPAPAPATAKFVNPWVSATQPNIPADPLEIVSNAEPVRDVAQRASAIKLLSNAQFQSNVRRGPYDLKTRFTSSDGTWQIEDSSPGRNIYRWAVQGPSYASVNLFVDRVLYSSQAASLIPLRVAQVHSAIFGHLPAYGPRATMRIGSGNLNGAQLTCVLVSHVFNGQAVSGPRRWEEYESCIDPKSGLLISYSPVPGVYIVFDYSNAQHLRDITFPGRFTITEAGQTVVEAQVISLGDPANKEDAIYTPAGLNPLGVGFPLTPAWRMQDVSFTGKWNPNATSGQIVVVRGMVSPDGTLTQAEVVASSDSNLNQKALERASQPRRMLAQGDENGATPQSHEAYFTTFFVTN